MTLQAQVVSPSLIALLQTLMNEEFLNAFSLAGGTALALRFGHRESIDIDLFTETSFDAQALAEKLKNHYGMTEAETAKNTVRGIIDGIKIDCIAHQYPRLKTIEVSNGIRIYSLEDCAAMKLNAIANRGCKKDFWDCAELLRTFSRDELLSFFAGKYKNDSLWNVEKSLVYFDDAEDEPDPRDLRGQSWEDVKKIIRQADSM